MVAITSRTAGWIRVNAGSSVRYLYFIRFSLLLWTFPVVFLLLDMLVTTTLSRGMWVPERWEGFTCVSFFLLATGCISLIVARTVVINGGERFADARAAPPSHRSDPSLPCEEEEGSENPPAWLRRLLVNETSREEHRALGIALVPALAGLLYALFLAWFERVPHLEAPIGIVAGSILAGLFWYVVNACYYLAYERPAHFGSNELLVIGQNAARTILLPRRWFWLKMPGEGIFAGGPPHTLEDITTNFRQGPFAEKMQHMITWIAARWNLPGYLDAKNGRLYEAQLFAIIASAGFLFLFLALYPLTAPGRTSAAFWAMGFVLLISIYIAWIIGSGKFPLRNKRNDSILLAWKCGLAGCSIAFSGGVFSLWWFSASDRFPVFASLLLMLILLSWALGALAFALDRFRVPVLTLLILSFLFPRMLHLYDLVPVEEHYLSTADRHDTNTLPTPAEVVTQKLQQAQDDGPLVIVTATGGGLHASAWTTQVLRQIYFRLADSQAAGMVASPDLLAANADRLNRHLLLMSTVSGGSVGLKYFLEALHRGLTETSFSDAVVAAQCSSLESVGWGLAYYDLPRAMLPSLSFLLWPSSGDGDLTGSPIFKDRTWALRRAWERNQADHYCWLTSDRIKEARATAQTISPGPRAAPSAPLTIADLPTSNGFPAFTMNTTAAEMGNRLLSANYRLPRYALGLIEDAPAESFLDIFEGGERPDLPLATAAQMSATFPYVSSAARIPLRYTKNADSAHFVDGGYYDNDGTASAIEFLRYALDAPGSGLANDPRATGDLERGRELHANLAKKPLKILLIEIRNSADEAGGPKRPPTALHPGGDKPQRASGVLDQIGFPAAGLWNAGHNSVTGRNRNGLDLLVGSHQDSLALRQIIFDDRTETAKCGLVHSAKDPLSWSLTPRQREEVVKNADRTNWLNECYTAAATLLLDGSNWTGASAPVRCVKPPAEPPSCLHRPGVEE